jgi:hypothetical protein
MTRVPPIQESLPLSSCDGEFTTRFATVHKVPASPVAKVIELSTWKSRPLEAAQSALISAVCQRAAHLAEIVSPRSKS